MGVCVCSGVELEKWLSQLLFGVSCGIVFGTYRPIIQRLGSREGTLINDNEQDNGETRRGVETHHIPARVFLNLNQRRCFLLRVVLFNRHKGEI